MEPESPLLGSQELSTCICPEPNQSCPQHSILSLKGQSECYLSTYVSVFLVVFFPLAFLPITYTNSKNETVKLIFEFGRMKIFISVEHPNKFP
jgi:hypothetical protein